MVFNEQACAGGNAEHSTHQSPGAFLRSKLRGQADDQVGSGSLSRPGGGTQKYFHGSEIAWKIPTMLLCPGMLRWKLYVAAMPWLFRCDGEQVHTPHL